MSAALRFAVILLAIAWSAVPHAADIPPPPEAVQEELEELEPEVTIVQEKDATYEEYRVNGKLYMVKVTPKVGPAYFFIDRDGDGLMESRMNDLDRGYEISVPQWVIFSW
ncbi:MAG: DUF2782 domain-containing protein [Pseudomonadota bacterium]